MSFSVFTADFELGSNGATIAATDPGSQTPLDQVDIGGSGSVAQYSTTYAAHGTLGARLKLATSGVTALHLGLGAGGTEQFGRCYLNPVSWPSSTINFFRFFNGATGLVSIEWDSNGRLLVNGSAFTNAIPLNQLARIEWHLIHDTSAGAIEYRLFTDADSTTPTETKLATGLNTGAVCNALVIGNSGSPGDAYETGIDQIVAGAPAYPGPFPVATVAPTVAGLGTIGSTLFCDTGTWNNGAQFVLAYQWTRDGTPIGGATASTYVLQDSDGGHDIGCVVTATGLVATNETASQASSNTIGIGDASLIGSGLTFGTPAFGWPFVSVEQPVVSVDVAGAAARARTVGQAGAFISSSSLPGASAGARTVGQAGAISSSGNPSLQGAAALARTVAQAGLNAYSTALTGAAAHAGAATQPGGFLVTAGIQGAAAYASAAGRVGLTPGAVQKTNRTRTRIRDRGRSYVKMRTR